MGHRARWRHVGTEWARWPFSVGSTSLVAADVDVVVVVVVVATVIVVVVVVVVVVIVINVANVVCIFFWLSFLVVLCILSTVSEFHHSRLHYGSD